MEEFLKLITWHHMAFIFALVFIIIFKRPLSELIRRITTINKEGLTASPEPESQGEKPNTEAVQQFLDVVGNSIVIDDLDRQIKQDLKEKGLSDEGDSIKVLSRYLAGTQLLLSFEQIHSNIFGSQLYLLKRLNETTGQGRHTSDIEKHIDHIKSLYPDSLEDWSYEKYLEFLFGHQLIIKHTEQIHITNLGVEYLTWVARNGRSENNPL